MRQSVGGSTARSASIVRCDAVVHCPPMSRLARCRLRRRSGILLGLFAGAMAVVLVGVLTDRVGFHVALFGLTIRWNYSLGWDHGAGPEFAGFALKEFHAYSGSALYLQLPGWFLALLFVAVVAELIVGRKWCQRPTGG